MNIRHYTAFLCIAFFAVIFSCSSDTAHLTVRSDSWPDGTSITIISDGRIIASSKLYGGRLRLELPKDIEFMVRAASPSIITFMGHQRDTYSKPDDYILPRPVKRYRYGSWRFGFSTNEIIKPDSSIVSFKNNVVRSLTAPLLDNRAFAGNRFLQDEMTGILKLSESSLSNYKALCDSAVIYGVDGLLLDPDDTVWNSTQNCAQMQEMIALVHDYGMSCDIRYQLDCAAGHCTIPPLLTDMFLADSSEMNPDELRVAFVCDSIPSIASVEKIEETLLSLNNKRIPLSRLAIEMGIAAGKYRIESDGSMTEIAIKPGEIDRIFRSVDDDKLLRLKDTSLRLGHSGSMYIFEDFFSIDVKITNFRSGKLVDCAGIHVRFDPYCLKPNQEELKRLSIGIKKLDTTR